MTAETYDNLPQHIKDIVDSWTDDGDKYETCARIVEELEDEGWTAEYGLDGEIHSVREVGSLYMCINCGGGFNREEMVMGDDDGEDRCVDCHNRAFS